MLHLVDSLLATEITIEQFPFFYQYAGLDCSKDWSSYLGRPLDCTAEVLTSRLSEALGVTAAEIAGAHGRLECGEWSILNVLAALGDLLTTHAGPRCDSFATPHEDSQETRNLDVMYSDTPNPVITYLTFQYEAV